VVPMNELTDAIRKARSGDEAAFGELVVRFSPAVRATCLMSTPDPDAADDLAQQIFLTAWNRLPTLLDEELFWPWLKSITRYHLLNEWRRLSRERTFKRHYTVNWLAEHALDVPDLDVTPDMTASRLECLRGCIDNLPEDLREIVRLTYEEKCTSDEIGKRVKRSSDAVRQSLVRIRERLKLCIERKLAAQEWS